MKKKFLALFISSALSISLFAQSADKVSEIIKTKEATYGQAAYLATSALGVIKNDSTYEDAFAYLKENGVISADVSFSDPINMKDLAWICSYTWEIKGSLMLKFFNSPRYVFRQMKVDEVFAFSADPMDIPNGRNLLAVITDCIETYQIKVKEAE